MLRANALELTFGGRTLFSELTFFIGAGDKVGLTGKNGAGKSTLLKVLLGEIKPDGGSVEKEGGCTLGYLPQEMDHDEESSVFETAGKAFDELNRLEERITQLGVILAERTDYESDEYMALTQELVDSNNQLGYSGSGEREALVHKVLSGLGFKPEDLNKPMKALSGGWKMRAELARILLSNPSVLLLDEPTNHLDIDSVEWLENYLKDYTGAILLISHDRAFLDNITKRTLEISNGKIYDYKAPYSQYVELRKVDLEKQKREKKNQEKYVKHTEELINKFRAKKSKAAFAQSLIRKLDKIEDIEIDEFDSSKIKFRFPPAPRSGKVVLEGSNLGKSYDGRQIFEGLDIVLGRQEKIALVGQNGAGKSTLFRLIAGLIEGEGEVILGHNVAMGYFGQYQGEMLDNNKTVFDTINDEAKEEMRPRVRAMLGAFLFSGDDVDKKVKVLSGGEKSRLALCKMLLKPHNFLLLDEPTNHLDIPSKEMLKHALKEFEGTLLVVSHDRDFLKGLTEQVYELRDGQLSIHHGDIYDFLDERKAESIRDFEKGKTGKPAVTNQKKQTKGESKDDYDERKEREKKRRRLSGQLQRLEEDINATESEIAALSQKLSHIHSGDQFQEVNNAILEKQSALEKLMEEWESVGQQLESVDQELNASL